MLRRTTRVPGTFKCHRIVNAIGACLLLTGSALAADSGSSGWRNDLTGRLEILALLQTLNAELLSHDSATLTLDAWCEAHHLATPARIDAEQVRGAQKAPDAQVLQQLRVNAQDVRYRRVKLHCGSHVLSNADNWYVPARLTPDMNHTLETTDTSFGRVVQPLHFQRHTLSARLLWSPLPAGWESGALLPREPPGDLAIPPDLIEHRAVLSLPDGTPFSVVVETYSREVLAFPAPSFPNHAASEGRWWPVGYIPARHGGKG